jgi:hypothetical protein
VSHVRRIRGRLNSGAISLALALAVALPLGVQAAPPADRSSADEPWSFRAPGTAPAPNHALPRVPTKTDVNETWGFHSPTPGGSSTGPGRLTSQTRPGGGFQGPRPIPGAGGAGGAGCASPGGG